MIPEFYCKDCAHHVPEDYGSGKCRRSISSSVVDGKSVYERAEAVRKYPALYPGICSFCAKSEIKIKYVRPQGFRQVWAAIWGSGKGEED